MTPLLTFGDLTRVNFQPSLNLFNAIYLLESLKLKKKNLNVALSLLRSAFAVKVQMQSMNGLSQQT